MGGHRWTFEEVRAVFEESGCRLLSKQYLKNNIPLDYICECGNEASITFKMFIKGQRCYTCRNEKIGASKRHNYDYVSNFFKENGCELLETEYKNSQTFLKYVCNCGDVHRIKFSHFRRGVRCYNCGIKKNTGKNNHNYNPNLTIEERIIGRKYTEYPEWRKSVYERDKYACQCCGDNRGGNLVAHHLDGYGWCKERRTDVTNGVTLCNDCHKDFHSMYGKKNNTETQYSEWIMHKTNERRSALTARRLFS